MRNDIKLNICYNNVKTAWFKGTFGWHGSHSINRFDRFSILNQRKSNVEKKV